MSSAALLAGIGLPGTAEAASVGERMADDPFRLGVASGEPAADGFVLWTRLAPDPVAPDGSGGMTPSEFDVEWEVAEDEQFARVVRRGRARATPELGHAVHPRVRGLRAGRPYYYRFRAQGFVSPAGRVRTTPALGTTPAAFRFATASCQAWYHGWFAAYRHLAAEDLDMVFFLGDYIYEYPITSENLWRQGVSLGEGHDHETSTLADYRLRYSLFKTDPDLQAAHAAAPFVVTHDDHEVQNNYADLISQYDIPPEEFELRRAAAYQAMYENAPLPLAARPEGPDARHYRRLSFGDLASVSVLDTRQYRDDLAEDEAEQNDPARSILGEEQESWLYEGLRSSGAAWNLLAQQVAVMRVTTSRTDQWDGYPAARQRLLDVLGEEAVSNPVVLTGDTHRAIAGDVHADFSDPDSPIVGSELICTSIASDGDGSETDEWTDDWTQHPWVAYYNGRRGYVRCVLTPQQLTADYRSVPYVEADGDAEISTIASFASEAGSPGLQS